MDATPLPAPALRSPGRVGAMSDANGWPDASKPGRPLNPERDGWHWLCAAVGIGAPYPMLWSADGKAWDTGDGWVFCTDPALTERQRYLGPCLLPEEVAAREAAAAAEEREACALIAVERGAWASNDADAESLVDRLEARGRMDMASEIAAAIRSRGKEAEA